MSTSPEVLHQRHNHTTTRMEAMRPASNINMEITIIPARMERITNTRITTTRRLKLP